jgi:hypothetical protein
MDTRVLLGEARALFRSAALELKIVVEDPARGHLPTEGAEYLFNASSIARAAVPQFDALFARLETNARIIATKPTLESLRIARADAVTGESLIGAILRSN